MGITDTEFEKIVRDYTPLVYHIAASVLGRGHSRDVEEVVSDAFAEYYRADKYDESEGGVRALLVTIARRQSLNRAVKLRRNAADELDAELAAAGLVDEEVINSLEAETIRDTVTSLPPPDDAIFTRRYYYGQSVREIAAALGVKPKFVENRLYYAKAELRRRLIEKGIGTHE